MPLPRVSRFAEIARPHMIDCIDSVTKLWRLRGILDFFLLAKAGGPSDQPL